MTAVATPVQRTLSAETRTKLQALARVWGLAAMELIKPQPQLDAKWVQPVADGMQGDQLAVAAVVTAFTTADAPRKEWTSQQAAVKEFEASTLYLIKELAMEAPADAQPILQSYNIKLQRALEERKAGTTALEGRVAAFQKVIDEVSAAATPSTTAAATY